ncbi:MAG TPA: DUF4838 domain-containing protein [Chthoniobacteraceae bacterium]|nr:DUF4838 domain-containing protein [Chthoniobacteraceae bacterium]
MKYLLGFLFFVPTVFLSAADLVVDGKPVSEIIVAQDALPQVRFAAKELQTHLEKISGAVVPMVASSSGGEVFPIYVGEQAQTRALGVDLKKLPMEGYRVVASGKALVLAGRDAIFPPLPAGFNSMDDLPRLNEEWQKITGRPWQLAPTGFSGLYNPRGRNEAVGFSVYDPTGTLFAVYDFLEQLGVRWYYPDSETGTVIPRLRTVSAEPQDHSAAPVFAIRYMNWGMRSMDLEGFLWFKRQKLGMSENVWFGHGVSYVTRNMQEVHPEFLAQIDGKMPIGSKKGTPPPRLAPPLRDAMIEFADKFFEWCPQSRTCAIGQSDGLVKIDDRDRAAGWDREERGRSGRFSDYVWKFVNEVAEGVARKHPDKTVLGLAYSQARLVPLEIDQLSPNLGVIYCQHRNQQMVDPAERKALIADREAWLAKMGNSEFYIWEYYLGHRPHHQLPGVPIIFTRIMQDDARLLRGKSKGEYVECSYGTPMRYAALNHYPYLVQARLYWNPDLDLDAFLDEYCRKYYGPAAEEMKAFLTFAEEVWMRPGPRTIGREDSFLKEKDVDRFFAILAQARAKTGKAEEAIYDRRVAAVETECLDMRAFHHGKDSYTEGVAAAEKGEGKAAAALLEAAAQNTTDPAARLKALVALAEVHAVQLDDAAAAIKVLEEGLAIRDKTLPVNVRRVRRKALYRCAELLRGQARYDEAVALLDTVEEKRQSGYWKLVLFRAYGEVAQARGDKAKAKEYYAKAAAVADAPKTMVEEMRRRLEE